MANGTVYKIRLGNFLKKGKIAWGDSNFITYSYIDTYNDSYIYFGQSNCWNHGIYGGFFVSVGMFSTNFSQ